MDDLPLRQDAVLWALGSLCQLNRVPFDQTLVLQHFPPPYSTLTLQHAAAALGFKVGTSAAEGQEVRHLALPCIALLKVIADAAPDQPEADPARSLALIVKADAGRIAFFTADSQSPQTIATSEFADHFEPTVLLFAREQQEVTDTDAPPASQFGFKWFIPELLKHKKIWRDVLLASLAIQLMALATPLFTQVVIDKVVVHHT
jgi:subfamily B ATP-binding cassette protein HlyB/CyaB